MCVGGGVVLKQLKTAHPKSPWPYIREGLLSSSFSRRGLFFVKFNFFFRGGGVGGGGGGGGEREPVSRSSRKIFGPGKP